MKQPKTANKSFLLCYMPPGVTSVMFLHIVFGFFFLPCGFTSHFRNFAKGNKKEKESNFQEILADRLIIKKQVPNNFTGTR